MITPSLQLAYNAYNSTNRARYPLNGGFVTNLEAIEHYLVETTSQLPTHLGLPMTIANMQTFRGEVVQALHGYHNCLCAAVSDIEKCQALTYLIVWHHYAGDNLRVDNFLKQLQHISIKDAASVRTLLKKIATILSESSGYLPPATEATPWQAPSVKHAIITLGYILNNDGSMAAELIQRLELTLQLSHRLPDSLILVTGGIAKQGKTESQQMKRWLIEHGVEPNRVIEEDQAINTIDNARLSLDLLAQHQVRTATIVSASIHVHRSQILFETLQWKIGTSPILFNHSAVNDGLSTKTVPTGQIRRNCYIDALRGYGLPAFNCKPLIQI